MKYVIVIQSSPQSAAALNAYRFSEAIFDSAHEIRSIFFYGDGVLTANSFCCPPQDEIDLYSNWVNLLNKHNATAIACIAAGLKRGILDEGEGNRYSKLSYNLKAPFELGGLGQLVEATHNADRVVTF